MNQAAYDGPRVLLEPGELHFGAAPLRISTLLGSCVSITLWHPRLRLGGMCHYVLGQRRQQEELPLDGRFGDEAFALLLEAIRAHACRPRDFQAKLFGGGGMLTGPGAQLDIGQSNIAQGRRLLQAAGIPLISEHVGGSGRRKITFDLASGQVWLAFPDGKGAQTRSPHGRQ